jgi:hypothetical protein
MSIAIAHPSSAAKTSVSIPARRYDHLFFSTMALLLLVTVFVGFARSYYLAGMFQAPLPSRIVHLHGAAFSCWILLLVLQTSLVFGGRTDIHRRLGIAGFLLAILMVILGVLAATDSLVREAGPPGGDPKYFYIIPLTGMMIFATLIFFAFRARFNPPEHKRLIFIATTVLTVAAIARWPLAIVLGNPPRAMLFSYIFLLILVCYDWWSTRNFHPTTIWASVFVIAVEQITLPIGKTAAWHSFASWVQSVAR